MARALQLQRVDLARPVAAAWLCVLLGACGGEGEAIDDAEDGASAIVGGRRETGYPSAGYLAVTAAEPGETKMPVCTVVLLRPDVAVTARHCVRLAGARYAVGFGAVGSSSLVGATVVPNPERDVAVLLLDADVPPNIATPAVVGATTRGATVRAIGYGRTATGDRETTRGTAGERKSYEQRVLYVDDRVVMAEGVDGGTCFGDSGGPLMAGDRVVGVSSAIERSYDGAPCREGNKVTYSRLSASCAFIDAAVRDRPRSGFQSFCP